MKEPYYTITATPEGAVLDINIPNYSTELLDVTRDKEYLVVVGNKEDEKFVSKFYMDTDINNISVSFKNSVLSVLCISEDNKGSWTQFSKTGSSKEVKLDIQDYDPNPELLNE